MGWLIAAIMGIGAVVTAAGNVKKARSAAEEQELKAAQLEELSKPGGYYDQQLLALRKEFADIEADRAAMGQLRAINALGLLGQAVRAEAGILAGAGAGNLAPVGSIVQRQEGIQQQTRFGLAKLQIQYEDVQRGLAIRQAQARAQETFTEFKKETGLEEAAMAQGQADWLKTWGIFFGATEPLLTGAADIIGVL